MRALADYIHSLDMKFGVCKLDLRPDTRALLLLLLLLPSTSSSSSSSSVLTAANFVRVTLHAARTSDTDRGTLTCGGRQAAQGHEQDDANTYVGQRVERGTLNNNTGWGCRWLGKHPATAQKCLREDCACMCANTPDPTGRRTYWRTVLILDDVLPCACPALALRLPCACPFFWLSYCRYAHKWEIDYLKEDSCHAPNEPSVAFQEYGAMRDALNSTGK